LDDEVNTSENIDNKNVVDYYHMLKKCLINDCPYDVMHLLDESVIFPIFKAVFLKMLNEHSKLKNRRYCQKGYGVYDPLYLDHYLILCYRFSHRLYKSGYEDLAKVVYYSSRIRCSVDIFYKTVIDSYFIPVHPFGTVISPYAKYGKGLVLYHNVLIGHYYDNAPSEKLKRPIIGDGVRIYSNAKVMGASNIGNNVTISMGTKVIDRQIPDNSKVMTAPNGRLIILKNERDNFSSLLVNSNGE
jgi:serine acetyltransferase